MKRRTLGDVKSELARIAGAVGMQATDTRVLDYLNIGIEELMNEGDWPMLIDRYVLKSYGKTVTLPAGYDRIMHCKLDNAPLQMQSPWYEYVVSGSLSPFDTSDLGLSGVLDRDDVLLYRDIPPVEDGISYTIRLDTVVDERDGTVLPDNVIVQGQDENGVAIRSNSGTAYIDGLTFVWLHDVSTGLQYAESTQVFSNITGALKPETKMPITVTIVPVGGGDNVMVGEWGPYEKCPRYRRYLINGLNDDTQYTINARLRKSFTPLVNDNDILPIGNIPALRAMMLAVYNFEVGKDDVYATKKMVAIDLLNKEAKAYRGTAGKKPVVTMSEGPTDSRGYYVS